MHRILQVESIHNLLTMDIEGSFAQPIIGALAKDNNGNIVKIQSVAISSGLKTNKDNTTIVVEIVEKIAPWGDRLTMMF